MLKRNIKIISALALVASIGTGFTTVNAASLSNNKTKAAYYANKDFKKGNSAHLLKTKLDALVKAGTITQDQETAALNLLTPSKTIKQKSANSLKTKLDTLVKAGTITQDQETAIINSKEQQETERKAEMNKVKNMTQAERKAYFESKKTAGKTNFLDSLVTAGTITKDQETAIQNLLKPNKDANVGKEKFANFLKTKLDTLVTAGTITQDQETAIINSLTSFTNKTSQN
ncbi:competence protein ComGC [Clostridium algifaecis]|uniref:Competence protein ComGC n=1 Tax=Clostridium algifaecis TaxID=1472040 RepID=A0ABS4KTC3_9CLOT|nr:hypothetical protein [Clostridium algifaecis]MBP2033289.1 competence protein ComGC [Clostridium algifaecis]